MQVYIVFGEYEKMFCVFGVFKNKDRAFDVAFKLKANGKYKDITIASEVVLE